MSAKPGFIYLIHFDRPFKHAKHYLGYTGNLEQRLGVHASNHSDCARLIHAVNLAGIGWTVSRLWRGGRDDERRLKNLGDRSRLCPTCKPGTRWGAFVPAYRPRKPIENGRSKIIVSSEALSYGVRCNDCGQWETACTCKAEGAAA
jgi:hypothetical protein